MWSRQALRNSRSLLITQHASVRSIPRWKYGWAVSPLFLAAQACSTLWFFNCITYGRAAKATLRRDIENGKIGKEARAGQESRKEANPHDKEVRLNRRLSPGRRFALAVPGENRRGAGLWHPSGGRPPQTPMAFRAWVRAPVAAKNRTRNSDHEVKTRKGQEALERKKAREKRDPHCRGEDA